MTMLSGRNHVQLGFSELVGFAQIHRANRYRNGAHAKAMHTLRNNKLDGV